MISNDTPINDASQDRFGTDPFAKAIARSISRIASPEGTVLALTGRWGSGKSSAINLILNHLKPEIDEGILKVIHFSAWWYSDTDSLTRSFFQHLYSGLGKSLSEAARRSVLSLGKKLLSSGAIVSTVADLVTLGLGGNLADTIAATAAEMIKVDRTAEDDYDALVLELRKFQGRFLVVIDDIDRLSPEQAVLVFKLVKSVGKLPNVIYLLAFDRDLAERTLLDKYPSERNFLEKIVQAAFEVPSPNRATLHAALLNSLVEIAGGHPEGQDGVRFRNVLADVVNPLVSLPRDLVRLAGTFAVTWAAIGDEVDFADLIAIEAMRLFSYPTFQAIQQHGAMLSGGSERSDRKQQVAAYDAIFLSDAKTDRQREARKVALRRLFPRLDSIWSNTIYSSENEWRAKRRICDSAAFSSYFSLSLPVELLPRKVLAQLGRVAGSRERVRAFFRDRAEKSMQDGRSEVPILLDELKVAPNVIPKDALPAFLSALFEIADEIDLERDADRGAWAIATTQLRLHWFINTAVRDRFSQIERGELLLPALASASLRWAVDVARRVYREHWPAREESASRPEDRIVDQATALAMVCEALQKISLAAAGDELSSQRDLPHILHVWQAFLGEGNDRVRAWVQSQLSDDRFIVHLAEAVTRTAWSSSIGIDGLSDRVSQGYPMASIEGLAAILDTTHFMERVAQVELKPLGERDSEILLKFKEGLRNHASRDRR